MLSKVNDSDGNIKFLLGRTAKMAFAVTLPLVMVGCSSVPDALNPAEWYRSTVDYVAGDDEEAEAKDGTETLEAESGEEKDFPKLNEATPESQASSAQERELLTEGLVADRSRARYSSEDVTRQGEAMSPLQDPSHVAEAPTAAAPRNPNEVSASGIRRPNRITAAGTPPRPAAQSLQEIYQAALSQKRPYANAVGEVRPTPDTSAMPSRPVRSTSRLASTTLPYQGGDLETVVISSSGVHSGGAFQAAMLNPAPSSAPSSQLIPVAVTKMGAHALAEFDPSKVSQSYKVATIQFNVGSEKLSASDRSILQKVSKLQKERGGTLRVVGHASSRTRDMEAVRHKMVNLKMSIDRADAIANTLMRLGVSPATLYVGALSDSDPVYYEVMPSGEAGNRRAEVFIDF